jgi:hypothetical protein
MSTSTRFQCPATKKLKRDLRDAQEKADEYKRRSHVRPWDEDKPDMSELFDVFCKFIDFSVSQKTFDCEKREDRPVIFIVSYKFQSVIPLKIVPFLRKIE